MNDRIEEDIDDAMSQDPLWDAEKMVSRLTGVDASYKDGGEIGETIIAVGFRNMFLLSKKKENLARLNHDTTLCNKLDYYLKVVKSLGFRKALEIDIPKREKDGEHAFAGNDKLFIFVSDDGLILRFDTYEAASVNASTLYYNSISNDPGVRCPGIGSGGRTQGYNPETGEVRDEWKHVSKYSATEDNPAVDEWRDYCNSNQWTVTVGDYDGREFLRRKVDGLRKGKLLSQWAASDFLWFLHYKDTKCPNCGNSDSRCGCGTAWSYDYKAINKARIGLADSALAKILGKTLNY